MEVEPSAAGGHPAMSRGDGYLLDSQVLLWWWFDPDRLTTAVRELLIDPQPLW